MSQWAIANKWISPLKIKGKLFSPFELSEFFPFMHCSCTAPDPEGTVFRLFSYSVYSPPSSWKFRASSGWVFKSKSLLFAIDEIQGSGSTSLIPNNIGMKHFEILCASNPFCFLLKERWMDNNTKKTKDIEACIYIIYYLHHLEFEFGLQSGRISFPM